MLSSEKAPPFLDRYLQSKIEAENFILEECPAVRPTFLRPGFIYDWSNRWWSIPLRYGVDAAWFLNDKIV